VTIRFELKEFKEGLHIDYNGTKIDSYKVNGKTVEDCCSHEIWNG